MRQFIRNPIGGIAITVAAAGLGVGIWQGGVISGPGAGLANEWVNTTAGASPSRCSPACAYDSTHAYGTPQTAENAASCGDLALVKDQTFASVVEVDRGTAKACTAGSCDQFQPDVSTATTGTTTGCVTFRPENPGGVTFQGGFWTNATFLRLDGFASNGDLSIVGRSGGRTGTSDSCNIAYGHDVIVQNWTDDGLFTATTGFHVTGARNVSFVNSTFGNWLVTSSAGLSNKFTNCDVGGTTHQDADHVMLNHVTIHDLMSQPAATGHAECLFLEFPRRYISVINSKIENCVQQNVSMQNDLFTTGGTPGCSNTVGCNIETDHVVFENDFLDATCSHCAALGYKVQRINNVSVICSAAPGAQYQVTFRNNSFGTTNGTANISLQLDPGCSPGPVWSVVSTGNIYTGITCSPAGASSTLTAAKNAILAASGTGCGSDTAFGSVTPPYVNEGAYDFHLSGSPGIIAGLVPASTGYPSTDIDGDTRPDPANAGADQ